MMTMLTQSGSQPTQDTLDPATPQPTRRRSIRSSLRFKSTLFAIAIGTLPALLIGSIGYIAVNRAITNWVEDTQADQARIIANELGYFVSDRFKDINALAQEPIFTNSQVRATLSVAEMEAFLDALLETKQTYESIAFLDIDGNDIATSGGANHSNHSEDDYFQAAIQGQTFISQPRFSKSAGQQVIFFAAPVKDSASNQTIGVVRTRVPVSTLLDVAGLSTGQTNQQELEQLFQFHLIDANSTIFASNERQDDDLLESLAADSPPTADPPAVDGAANEEGIIHVGRSADELFPNLAEVREAGTANILRTSDLLDGEEELLGYAPISTFDDVPNPNWAILLEVELEEAFKVQRSLIQTILLGSLLSMAVVGTVAAVIASRGLKPIEEAATAVEQISQGNFATRVTWSGDDEIAILGANINRMADQIQNLLGTLRQNADQLKQQNNVLFNLSRSDALIQGNSKAAATTCTEVIANTLEVERVSIWMYSGDRTKLISLDQFDRSQQQHVEGHSYTATHLPNYFQALQTNAPIVIHDIETDATVQELLTADLVPANTRSILIVPIQIGDRSVGMIQCEQVEEARVWQAGEQTFVYSIASLISLALESETLQNEVGQLLDVVSLAGNGNLTVQAKVSDRVTGLVADIFNQLIERLSQVLNQVLHAAHQVSGSAKQQKELAEVVAINAQQQAQGVNQVMDLAQQVEQSAQGSAQQVDASSQSLQAVSETVASGQNAIDALTEGMEVLQEGTNRMMQRMKTLGEFVGLADQFVQDQSQIAFITQTLALNASLVAARASEQRDPRQFIVVAREFDSIAEQVSKLAQKTNDGLTNLEQRSAQIHSVVSAVDADVQSLGKLVEQFNQGIEQSKHIFSQVQTVTDEAVEAGQSVAQFSRHIVQATESTVKVMQDIARLSAQTAELTQTSQAQSDRIEMLSTQLLQSVHFFQLPTTRLQLSSQEKRVDLSQTETITLDVELDDTPVDIALSPTPSLKN